MKTNSIKTVGLKGIFTKVVLAGSIAAAVFMAAPQKAEAQQFRIGVQFGHPGYVAPAYPVYNSGYGYGYNSGYGYDYNARIRHEEWERREAIARHEAWERRERFEHDRRFDRDYRR